MPCCVRLNSNISTSSTSVPSGPWVRTVSRATLSGSSTFLCGLRPKNLRPDGAPPERFFSRGVSARRKAFRGDLKPLKKAQDATRLLGFAAALPHHGRKRRRITRIKQITRIFQMVMQIRIRHFFLKTRVCRAGGHGSKAAEGWAATA